jgi:urea-proton symporter
VHPRAAGKEILLVSRLASLTFGLLSGVFCIVLLQIGININWLFFVIGWVAHRSNSPVCMPLSVCMLANYHHSGGRSARGSQSLSVISQHGRG